MPSKRKIRKERVQFLVNFDLEYDTLQARRHLLQCIRRECSWKMSSFGIYGAGSVKMRSKRLLKGLIA